MPYQDADHRLRALAGRAEGFGRHAIGGLHGSIYRVTSLQGTYARRGYPRLSQSFKPFDWFLTDEPSSAWAQTTGAGA